MVLMNSMIQTLENKAAKMLYESLQRLKWLSLAIRRHNHRCTFIYKCINGLIDFDFDLTRNEKIHDHSDFPPLHLCGSNFAANSSEPSQPCCSSLPETGLSTIYSIPYSIAEQRVEVNSARISTETRSVDRGEYPCMFYVLLLVMRRMFIFRGIFCNPPN